MIGKVVLSGMGEWLLWAASSSGPPQSAEDQETTPFQPEETTLGEL